MKEQDPESQKTVGVVPRANAVADVSLVLGISGLLVSTLLGFWSLGATVPGLILGLFGLSSQTRRPYAVAGIITSSLGIIITLVWMSIVASFANVH